ncbi:MAG: exo-alpha-sialidase [Phycisphaerae bacterium]|nr:exo-alpha-sialidase [Phycisphaerae bacterium]
MHSTNTVLAALLTFALVMTSARTLLAAEPFFEQQDLFVGGDQGIHTYRIPALATTNKGTVIAFCDARVERGGDLPNHIDQVMKRSFDGGKTWSAMTTVLDFPAPNGGGDPTLLVDRQTGTIWMFYVYGIPDPKVKPRGRILWAHAIKSDDDGATWSKPIDLTSSLKKPGWDIYVSAPGSGIQTRGGRLLMPSYHRAGKRYCSFLACSDDHGKTWHIGGDAPEATNECEVVELVDGSLMLNMRSDRGKNCRVVAISKDGGKTWSEGVDDATLVEPVCQASFQRYTSQRGGYAKNRLLFSNPADKKRRNMTVRLSYDEGKTWPVAKVVHPGPAAYSSIAILPDGKIGLFYECGKKGAYEKIAFARFNVEWLTDGKDRLERKK